MFATLNLQKSAFKLIEMLLIEIHRSFEHPTCDTNKKYHRRSRVPLSLKLAAAREIDSILEPIDEIPLNIQFQDAKLPANPEVSVFNDCLSFILLTQKQKS